MISNKYKFIFIHTPKTGGTSVAKAFHIDTDQECELAMEPDDEGIAGIFPNEEDFPWWRAWMRYQYRLEVAAVLQYEADLYASLSPTDMVFSGNSVLQHCGHGNIKHLPMQMWYKLLHDERLRSYNSFTVPYMMVGTCRNPYTREFSLFLYESRDILEETVETLKDEGASNKEIADRLKFLWIEWCVQSLNNVEGSQAMFCTAHAEPFDGYHPLKKSTTEGLIDLPFFIRLEHVEEDYEEFCNLAGIERKSSQIPHLLNHRAKWAEYLPDNILEWYAGRPLELIHCYRDIDFQVLPYEKGSIE